MTRQSVPGSDRTEVHLWTTSVTATTDESDRLHRCESDLSPQERYRADRFHFPRDRAQFVVARSLLRRCLSQFADIAPSRWEFEFNALGKPAVDRRHGVDLTFNLSHSRGMCMLGVTRERSIGVDVEKRDAPVSVPDLIHRVMSDQEIEELRSLHANAWRGRFMDVWVLKEAYTKARGQGISLPLRDISFLFSDGRTSELVLKPSLADRPENWFHDLVEVPVGFHAAVCVGRHPDEELRLVFHEPARP